jgi:hypothetical protein
MAGQNEFTFVTDVITVGLALATKNGHVRDRFNNLLAYKPGDYIVQLADDSLTVMVVGQIDT